MLAFRKCSSTSLMIQKINNFTIKLLKYMKQYLLWFLCIRVLVPKKFNFIVYIFDREQTNK